MDALIDAAEARFAEDGFGGASLRAVMRDAGADPGAVHYHFGSREALASAVLDRVLGPVNDRRLANLVALVAADALDLGRLVRALVEPDLEVAAELDGRGSGRSRLLGSIYLHPAAFVVEQVESRFAPVAARFHPHLIAAVPHVPPEELAWRVRWCVFGTLGAVLSDPDRAGTSMSEPLADRLVPVLAAALEAASTPRGGT